MDATPTHRNNEAVEILKSEHESLVESLKRDHEKEMSELRKYFEGVCQELEVRLLKMSISFKQNEGLH